MKRMQIRKPLVLLALVLVIATSVVAGTLATYQINLDDYSSGEVAAKNFVLTSAGDSSFATDVKIAPTESVSKTFTVANFDNGVVTETDMDVAIAVALAKSGEKSAIPELEAVVEKDGVEVGTSTITNGQGTISIADEFTASTEETHTYTVTVSWPAGENDVAYQGAGFGQMLTIDVVGTQK